MLFSQKKKYLLTAMLACVTSANVLADLSDKAFELNGLDESLVEQSLRQKVGLLLDSPTSAAVTTGLELPISIQVPDKPSFSLPLNSLSNGYGLQLIESIPFYDSINFALELSDPIQTPDCSQAVQEMAVKGDVDIQALSKVTCGAGTSDFQLKQSVAYGKGPKCEVVSGNRYQCTETTVSLEPTDYWYNHVGGLVDFNAQINTKVKSRNNIPTVKDSFVPISVSGITVMIPAKVNEWEAFRQTASSANSVAVNGISTNRSFAFGCQGYQSGLQNWTFTPASQYNSRELLVGSYAFKKQATNGLEINSAKLLGNKCPNGITFYGTNIASSQSAENQTPLKLTVELSKRSDAADLVSDYSDLLADMLQNNVSAYSSYQSLISVIDNDTDAVSSHLVNLSAQIRQDIEVYLTVLEAEVDGFTFDINSLFTVQGYFKPAVLENYQQPAWLSNLFYKGQLGFYYYNNQVYSRNLIKKDTINALYSQIIQQRNISPKSIVAELLSENENNICQIHSKAILLLNAVNASSYSPDDAEVEAIQKLINSSVEGFSCKEAIL